MEFSIRVFEGRGFGKLPANHAVRVQGVLLDRVQETSSSKFSHGQTFGAAQPSWENDRSGLLVWKLSKSELATARAGGGSLKLYCYSTTRRGPGTMGDSQPLGYVLLNLNAPSLYQAEDETKPEWHKLRGISKMMEIKLRCTINSALGNTSDAATPTGPGQSNAFDTVVVSEDAEYIPIGSSGGNELFTLDVTLAGVGGLDLIWKAAHAPSTVEMRQPEGPFHLTYGMFGVVTDTGSFDSLGQPLFHPIVDSFRVKSCAADLAHFFAHEVLPLEVRLCGAGNKVLASAQIDCAPLAGAVGAKEFHGAELEGSYPLQPRDVDAAAAAASLAGPSKPMLYAAVAIRPLREADDDAARNDSESEAPVSNERVDSKKDAVGAVESAANAAPAAGIDVDSASDSLSNSVSGSVSDSIDGSGSQAKEDLVNNSSQGSVGGGGDDGDNQVEDEDDDQGYDDDDAFEEEGDDDESGKGDDGPAMKDGQSANKKSQEQKEIGQIEQSTPKKKNNTDDHLSDSSRKNNQQSLSESPKGMSKSSKVETGRASATIKTARGQSRRGARGQKASVNLVSKQDRIDQHDDSPRRYRLSIDLRSIRDVASPSTVYLAYTLSQFGAMSAMRTRPPLRLVRNSESLLPHGYQMFDVVMRPSELERAVASPLSIEVMQKDKYQQDSLMGVATVPLQGLLSARKFFRDARSRKTFASLAMLRSYQKSSSARSSSYVTVRTEDRYFQVLTKVPHDDSSSLTPNSRTKKQLQQRRAGNSPGGRIAKVASLRVVIYLEDLGMAKGALAEASNMAVNAASRLSSSRNTREEIEVEEMTSTPRETGQIYQQQTSSHAAPEIFGRVQDASALGSATMAGASRNLNQSNAGMHQSSSGQVYDPASDPRNQEALAEWVAAEYKMWEEGMRKKELVRMEELEAAWVVREQERRTAVSNAQKQYTNLEAKLRHKLDLVEQRERALHLKELEVNRRAEVQAGELKIQQRRLEEELHHKVSIERRKIEELTTRVKQLTKGRDAAEDRARKVEADFANYRNEQRSTPEAVLHARVAELTQKCSELTMMVEVERAKAENERRTKVECQAQLGRLVRELQAVRREQRLVSERNMEQLRLQYIAREERYILDGDRQELRSIKNELDDLKRLTQSREAQAPTPSRAIKTADKVPDLSVTAEHKRLAKEKANLLSTGVYSTNHPIIQQLDKKMQML